MSSATTVSKNYFSSLYGRLMGDKSSKVKTKDEPLQASSHKVPRPTSLQEVRTPTKKEFDAQIDTAIASKERIEQISKEKQVIQNRMEGTLAEMERVAGRREALVNQRGNLLDVAAEHAKAADAARAEMISIANEIISKYSQEIQFMLPYFKVDNDSHKEFAGNLLWFIQEAEEIKALAEQGIAIENQRAENLDVMQKDFLEEYGISRPKIIAGEA